MDHQKIVRVVQNSGTSNIDNPVTWTEHTSLNPPRRYFVKERLGVFQVRDFMRHDSPEQAEKYGRVFTERVY